MTDSLNSEANFLEKKLKFLRSKLQHEENKILAESLQNRIKTLKNYKEFLKIKNSGALIPTKGSKYFIKENHKKLGIFCFSKNEFVAQSINYIDLDQTFDSRPKYSAILSYDDDRICIVNLLDFDKYFNNFEEK